MSCDLSLFKIGLCRNVFNVVQFLFITVKQQQLYFRDDGFPINVVVQRIVTNRLIEKAKKNGQSGLFSADKLPFHDFHFCCCYSYWCLFNYKITIIVLQFATQDSDVLFFFFFSKNIAGPSKQSPSHHLNYSVCIFFFCFTLIFNFIANQRILKGKDKNFKRLRHSITQSQINKGSVHLTVACPATAIAKHQMAK